MCIGVWAGAVLTVGSTSANSGWHEVRSPHFVVYSNGGERMAKRVAADLEQIRFVLGSALPRTRGGSKRPLGVIAVERSRDLSKLLPGYEQTPGGLFRADAYGPQVGLIAADGPYYKESLGTVYHEFFHYLAALNRPSLPGWLNEGLASFWGKTEIRRDKIIVGRPNERYVRALRRGHLFPIEEVLRGVNVSSNLRLWVPLYAQRWALAHHLMLGDRGAHRENLARYIGLVGEGSDVVEAAREAFGELNALQEVVRLYGRKKKTLDLVAIPIDTSLSTSGFEARELPVEDALAMQGRFIVDGIRSEKALPLLEQALAKQANQPMALEAMAVLEVKRRDRESAKDWIQKAVESKDASAYAYWLHTILLPGGSHEGPLLRALAQDREFVPAYVALAYHYASVDGSPARALAMAREASDRAPASGRPRFLVARVLGEMGAPDEAKAQVERAVRVAISSGGRESNNACWFGSLSGFAEQVMPACESAVNQDPDVGGYRDSRGLARALNGDYAAAIADFRSYLDADGQRPEKVVVERSRWIQALERGDNPFDDNTLESLLGIPF